MEQVLLGACAVALAALSDDTCAIQFVMSTCSFCKLCNTI